MTISVDNIPVILNFDHAKPVGKGRIEDGVLIIEVQADQIVREIEYLATIDHIRSVSLGLEYQATRPNRS